MRYSPSKNNKSSVASPNKSGCLFCTASRSLFVGSRARHLRPLASLPRACALSLASLSLRARLSRALRRLKSNCGGRHAPPASFCARGTVRRSHVSRLAPPRAGGRGWGVIPLWGKVFGAGAQQTAKRTNTGVSPLAAARERAQLRAAEPFPPFGVGGVFSPFVLCGTLLGAYAPCPCPFGRTERQSGKNRPLTQIIADSKYLSRTFHFCLDRHF